MDAGAVKQQKSTAKAVDLLVGSDRTGDLAGAQTPCTDVYMARSTVDNCLNALHIGLPSLVGTSVRMGNFNTKGHALAAKITLSH